MPPPSAAISAVCAAEAAAELVAAIAANMACVRIDETGDDRPRASDEARSGAD
jgi:hypothetical protein